MTHFYTSDWNEVTHAQSIGYNHESIAFYAF